MIFTCPNPTAQALSMFQSILLPLGLGQSINHDNAIYISNYCIISTHNPQNCRKEN